MRKKVSFAITTWKRLEKKVDQCFWTFRQAIEIPMWTEMYIVIEQSTLCSIWQVVLVLINSSFSDRWIGRGGKTNWPHPSPDLTSCHFFCEDGPKSKSSYLNQKHLVNSKIKLHGRNSCWLHKGKHLFLPCRRSVCRMLGALLKSVSEWWCVGFKWCKYCSNVAFRLGDTTV